MTRAPVVAPARSRPAAGPTTRVRDRAAGLEALIQTEWILTNGLGGFAMGTASGIPTRRYHALLVAPMHPPVDRVAALHSIVETLTLNAGSRAPAAFDLSSYEFSSGLVHPRGHQLLVDFSKDLTVRWRWRIEGVEVEKEVALDHGRNAVAVRYRVGASPSTVRLTLRPLLVMRDMHALIRREPDRFAVRHEASGFEATAQGRTVVVRARGASVLFDHDPQWWHDFHYRIERDRGYDHTEDAFSPGTFTADLAPSASDRIVELRAWCPMPGTERDDPVDFDRALESRRARFELATRGLPDGPSPEKPLTDLAWAADEFIVKTRDRSGTEGISVIAGYPWFGDWGRDTFVSLPGLFLVTGRHAEAGAVLEAFARTRSRGLIPNRFDDYGHGAEYNTVDGPLWFIHAACAHARAARAPLTPTIRQACLETIDAFLAGTDYGIAVDPGDGLVMHGDPATPLTWMDAKRDGIAFTPRHGKAVEINALWHHALVGLAALLEASEPEVSARLGKLAARARRSFRSQFWDEARRSCFDTLERHADGVWRPTPQMRPNQVFAASLENSPLTPAERRGVVDAVRSRLWMPVAVRTLDAADPAYRPRYLGRMFDRDASYHNGTAWPWLMGPLAEAILRVGKFSAASVREARALLEPLVAQLDGACLGQLPELYDAELQGDRPRADGCPAQAWSVAETLRVMDLIRRA